MKQKTFNHGTMSLINLSTTGKDLWIIRTQLSQSKIDMPVTPKELDDLKLCIEEYLQEK